VDVSKINNITELKALAYDELIKVEAAQANLRVLNDRIAELQLQDTVPLKPTKTDSSL